MPLTDVIKRLKDDQLSLKKNAIATDNLSKKLTTIKVNQLMGDFPKSSVKKLQVDSQKIISQLRDYQSSLEKMKENHKLYNKKKFNDDEKCIKAKKRLAQHIKTLKGNVSRKEKFHLLRLISRCIDKGELFPFDKSHHTCLAKHRSFFIVRWLQVLGAFLMPWWFTYKTTSLMVVEELTQCKMLVAD